MFLTPKFTNSRSCVSRTHGLIHGRTVVLDGKQVHNIPGWKHIRNVKYVLQTIPDKIYEEKVHVWMQQQGMVPIPKEAPGHSLGVTSYTSHTSHETHHDSPPNFTNQFLKILLKKYYYLS